MIMQGSSGPTAARRCANSASRWLDSPAATRSASARSEEPGSISTVTRSSGSRSRTLSIFCNWAAFSHTTTAAPESPSTHSHSCTELDG